MLQTYRASAPKATHTRAATCKEVDCHEYLAGWKTVVSVNLPEIGWIRHESGLRFTESREGKLITFLFAPGQACFSRNKASHRIALNRTHIYTVNNGRGFSRREPAQWVDEMGEQLYKLRG
jgi:hypothetical protein